MIVTVPGSSSNFGPGFDCLGLAFQLYDRIAFEAADRLLITGCEERFRSIFNFSFFLWYWHLFRGFSSNFCF